MVKKRSAKKVVEEEIKGSKKLPVGVQIISVLYYIGAVLGVVFGLLFVSASGYLASMIPELAGLGAGLFVFLGILLIGVGVLGFFVGRGLWGLKPWARIFAIILAALGILSAIYSMITNFSFGNIVSILIHGFIGYYLLLNKEAKRAFK
jgi:hypothetical protein